MTREQIGEVAAALWAKDYGGKHGTTWEDAERFMAGEHGTYSLEDSKYWDRAKAALAKGRFRGVVCCAP